MSKILIILSLLLTAFLTKEVHAQTLQNCASVRTDPAPLISDPTKTSEAKFFVNVGNVNNYGGSWKIQFECGWIQNAGNVSDITKETNGQEISREINNDSRGCEFSAGIHTLKTIAVVNGKDVPQCVGVYKVLDSDSLCQLDIIPQTGLTSASNIIVKGTDLTKDGRFGLFIDKAMPEAIIGPIYVTTPDFGIEIPSNLLTPGAHSISLRKYSHNYMGEPLCSLNFTVGTPDKPGSIIKTSSGTTSTNASISVIPAISKGKEVDGCTNQTMPNPQDPTKTIPNPAIATAIGCIHTNPAELVKDLMTFVIGIGGGLAFLMMLLGAFQMLTSAGNPETLNAGKDRLTSAVIGLLFVIFAVLLMQIIGADILKIPGFIR